MCRLGLVRTKGTGRGNEEPRRQEQEIRGCERVCEVKGKDKRKGILAPTAYSSSPLNSLSAARRDLNDQELCVFP
jgi:hypothetical protein